MAYFHRKVKNTYVFRVYAPDSTLDLENWASKDQFLDAIQGYIPNKEN